MKFVLVSWVLENGKRKDHDEDGVVDVDDDCGVEDVAMKHRNERTETAANTKEDVKYAEHRVVNILRISFLWS